MAEQNRAAGASVWQHEARQALSLSFHALPAPTAEELHTAEQGLLESLPDSPEEIEEIQRAASDLSADPQRRKSFEHMTSMLGEVDLSKVSRALIPVVLYVWLCNSMGLPLDARIAPGQHGDFIGVITIVLMVAFYLWPLS